MSLGVDFGVKTDSGYPKDAGLSSSSKKSFFWSGNFVYFFLSSPQIGFFQIWVVLCKTRHLVGAQSKNVIFWPRRYKKKLNGKKCDDSAVTETCFSLPVSDMSLILEAWSRKAIWERKKSWQWHCTAEEEHGKQCHWQLGAVSESVGCEED